MWAGGRVTINGTLRCGETAIRRTRVLSVQDKRGRSGPLTIYTVGHQIFQNNVVVIDEEQDIVYREAAVAPYQETPSPSREPGVPAVDEEWAIDTAPTLLFRFSALTYNAHRIHYDRDYARDVEGYPGLLVHGPLQVLAMAEAARAVGQDGCRSFEYRLFRPLFDHEGMVVKATPDLDIITTSVRNLNGHQTASGRLFMAD
jgi:3-methylfumaryl-CoA hydratase